jgi:ectoine hydroxylase-related dioxygenase (phytanoyl-CoA dioxygenase family)
MAGRVTEAVGEEHIRAYREQGFVQVDEVLSPEELEELRSEIDRIYATDRGGIHTSRGQTAYARVLDQRVNIWRDNAVVRRFVLHPRLAEMARRLAGARAVRLWHDHALLKQPGDSKPTPWHQDLPYWPMREPGALSVWIALDDVDERNGAMAFVPGSHRVGVLPGINLVDPEDIFAMVPAGALAGVRPVTVRLRAGSCTFHDGRTFHYAYANRTSRPRRAMVIIYMPDGTTYSGKRHIVTDGLGLREGEPLAGELFPVLAEERGAAAAG